MSDDRATTVRSLVDAALSLPEGERTTFVVERCGDDDGLLRAVVAALEERFGVPSAFPVAERLREPGDRLGPFTIVERLGSGGMGHVYRAVDARLGREVALKVLRPEVARDPQHARRFESEARLASRLNHPSVATVYEFGEDRDTRYIAMELVGGRTLRERLSGGPLPTEEVIRIGAEVARALAEAHAIGITHRDVKATNVMVDERGRVKVLDFGVAKATDPAGPSMTSSGLLVGTPEAMSPEQVEGRSVDARTDVFGLGVLLYQMATGRLPFVGASIDVLLERIRTEDPSPPSAIQPGVPRGLERVIETCLKKRPDERYPSAAAVARELEALGRRSSTRSRRRSWIVGSAAAGALALALMWVMWRSMGPSSASPSFTSLAVLPLADLSASADQAYLADGLIEALIGELGRIRSLRVISHTSTMSYKGKAVPVTRIAEDLDVDVVLEGSIQCSADTASIRMRLVDARRDQTLWSRQYKRRFADVLDLQKEVALQVVSEIHPRLEPHEEQELEREQRVDPEAEEAYLRGLYWWNKRTAEGVERAIELFERAKEIEPDYAMAHVGLAQAYALSTPYTGSLPGETYPRAKAAAWKALELDVRSGEAYAVLALVEHEFDRDQEQAEENFEKALELSPNAATARQWYAEFLTRAGRHEEALAMIEEAKRRDPISLIVNSIAGWVLCFAGRCEEAEATLGRVLEMDGRFLPAHVYRAMTFSHRGRYEEAIDALLSALELSPGNARVLANLAVANAIAGKREEALRILDQLEARGSGAWIPPYHFATIHAALGDREAAFTKLELALEGRGVWPLHLRIDPVFDDLRDDPRWPALARAVGFP